MKKKIRFIFFLGLLLNPFLFSSQESTLEDVSIGEKNNIKFQKYFFKALIEKSINHYKKAIRNLEECSLLLQKNTAVLFELSKNYYYLNKTIEATEFAKQALEIEPNNNWILEHLVAIYKKEQNFKKAIVIQKRIIKIYPKKKDQLIFLYLQEIFF